MAVDSASLGSDEENPFGGRVMPICTPSLEELKKGDPRKGPATLKHLLAERLGLHEFVSPSVWRAAVAEVLGTGILVFLIDTIVVSSFLSDTKLPHLLIALAVAVAITILLLATAPVSGGHINPIVTFSAGLVGVISPARTAVYIAAQCGGAVLGALGFRAVVGHAIEESFALGGCTLKGVELSQALWLEIICSFVFLYASVWMVFDSRQLRAHGPVVVCSIIGAVLGLLVFVSLTVTGKKGYSGAGINPARCLGPALVRGGHLWDDHWVYWVGPATACVGFYLYVKAAPQQHFRGDEELKYDFFTTLRVLCTKTGIE